jgi:HD-like signal output (HDOD) protein
LAQPAVIQVVENALAAIPAFTTYVADRMAMEHDLEVLDREAEEIINDIGIPPCPSILTTLMREMRSDEPDFVKLGKLIGSDVSLAAAMLKTVNSPFYGLRNKATSVQQAIALLGLRNVAQIVTGLLLRQAFPGGSSDILDEYWELSSAIAGMSALLAGRLKGMNRDEAYTFALFRDCGMLAMLGNFEDYKPKLPGAKGDADACITEIEDKLYGMNHARLGSRLARAWLLPDDVCDAIQWHHDYAALMEGRAGVSPAGTRNIALTLAAQCIYCRNKMGIADADWRRGSAFALAQLGLEQDALDALGKELMKELETA